MKSFSEWFCKLLFLIVFCSSGAHGDSINEVKVLGVTDLLSRGDLYIDDKNVDLPKTYESVDRWLEDLEPVKKFKLTGGDYWFVVDLKNTTKSESWVISVHNTLVEKIQAVVLADKLVESQSYSSGYYANKEYPFLYGNTINLKQNISYKLIINVDSRVFASPPNISIYPEPDYRTHSFITFVVVLFCFGGMLALIAYNLFVYFGVKDNVYLFYSAYLSCYLACWGLQWHLVAEIWEVHYLPLHYVFFLLLPITNAYFCIKFLDLNKNQPRLSRVLKIIGWLSLVCIPIAFWKIQYINIVTTIVVSLWLVSALYSGVIAYSKGVESARYFIIAFLCLLIPSVIVLPANVGLIPDLFENTELIVLVGGTFDGLFLAFAMANRLKYLSGRNYKMESDMDLAVQERTSVLSETNKSFDLLVNEFRQSNVIKYLFK